MRAFVSAVAITGILCLCYTSGVEASGRSLQQAPDCVAPGGTVAAGQTCCAFSFPSQGICKACGGGAAAADQTCCPAPIVLPPCFSTVPPLLNTNRNGNNLQTITVPSLEACYRACNNNANCAFFVHTPAATSLNCVLKSVGLAGSPNIVRAGSNLYDVRACQRITLDSDGAIPSCAVALPGFDLPNFDISGTATVSGEACFALCADNPNCVFAKWDSNFPTCFQKTVFAGLSTPTVTASGTTWNLTDCKPGRVGIVDGGCVCKAGWNPFNFFGPVSCSKECGDPGEDCCYGKANPQTLACNAVAVGVNTCNADVATSNTGKCNVCGQPDAACCKGANPCVTSDTAPYQCQPDYDQESVPFAERDLVCKPCGIEDEIPCLANGVATNGMNEFGCILDYKPRYGVCAKLPLRISAPLAPGKCWEQKDLFGSPPFVDYFGALNTYNRWQDNRYCIFSGETSITVNVQVFLRQANGDCAICPTAAKCQFWHPDTTGIYRGWCSASTVGKRITLRSTFPGDESKMNFGYDPYPHYHYACCCGKACFKNKFYLGDSWTTPTGESGKLDFNVADRRLRPADDSNIAIKTGPNTYSFKLVINSDETGWWDNDVEVRENDVAAKRASNPRCFKPTPQTWKVVPQTEDNTNACPQ